VSEDIEAMKFNTAYPPRLALVNGFMKRASMATYRFCLSALTSHPISRRSFGSVGAVRPLLLPGMAPVYEKKIVEADKTIAIQVYESSGNNGGSHHSVDETLPQRP
jgi:hypothetical protein